MKKKRSLLKRTNFPGLFSLLGRSEFFNCNQVSVKYIKSFKSLRLLKFYKRRKVRYLLKLKKLFRRTKVLANKNLNLVLTKTTATIRYRRYGFKR